MLHPFLNEKLPEITKMFKEHHVKSAYAFGSVVTDKFNDKSDVDLLHRQLDLVTVPSLTNPYFIEELNETKQYLYGERN